MEVHLISYADDRHGHKDGVFRENQLNLVSTAKKHGVKKFTSWTYDDLRETNFYNKHAEYIDKSRFDNGVVWKPFIILDKLKQVNEGDIVFYHDCMPWGLNRSIKPLINLCLQNNGILFRSVSGQKNSNWTKRDAFVFMNCDEPKYYNHSHSSSGWLIIVKNDFNIKFVEEWLMYNLDERIASYRSPNVSGLPELPGHKENRGDQSIFSNLVIKYGLKGFDFTNLSNINEFIDLMPMRHLPKPIHPLIKKIYYKFFRIPSKQKGW